MKNMISDQKTVPVPGRGKKFNGGKTLRGKKVIITSSCIVLAAVSCIAGVIGVPLEAEGTALQVNRQAITSSRCIRKIGEETALLKSEEAAEAVLKRVITEGSFKETTDKDVLKDTTAKASLKKTADRHDDRKQEEIHGEEHGNKQSELLTTQKTESDPANDDEKVAIIEEIGETPALQDSDTAADNLLQNPVEGFIVSSPFGPRWGTLHTGIDLALAQGNPIYAAGSGTVNFSGYGGGYGNLVKIDHGNGMQTNYAHCSQLLVSQGQQVERGETIALVGSTGNSTGPHLHFEVIIDGSCVDPAGYLDLE